MNECKKRGIRILPPDINKSQADFIALDNNTIQYRITTITHVGETAINHIQELRPIKSFQDFMERRKKQDIRANVLVNLVKAGCFDFDEPRREYLLWLIDMQDRSKKEIKEDFQCPTYAVDHTTYSKWEKEVLGAYLSTHPMEKYGFKDFFTEYKEGDRCIIGGEVVSTHFFKDKRGNLMCFASIETLFGTIKTIVFSSSMSEEVQQLLELKNIVLIRGRKSGNDIIFDSGEILE